MNDKEIIDRLRSTVFKLMDENKNYKNFISILKQKYVQMNILKNSSYEKYIKHCNYFRIEEKNVMTLDEWNFVKGVFYETL